MKETEAARAVLLEVLNALGAMRDDLVIVPREYEMSVESRINPSKNVRISPL